MADAEIRNAPGSPPSYSQVTAAVWQCYALSADQVPTGTQRVKIILDARNEKMACNILLTDVELLVKYSTS